MSFRLPSTARLTTPILVVTLSASVMLTAGLGRAAAQTPAPPPPSGELPSPADGVLAPPIGNVPPPLGDLPMTQTDPPPQHEAGSHRPGKGPTPGGQSPTIVGPANPIELAEKRSSINGRRLLIPLRCQDSGTVELRRKRHTIARTSFACVDHAAVISFRLPKRHAKALRRAGPARVALRFEIRGSRSVVRLTVERPQPRLRAASTSCTTDNVGVELCYHLLETRGPLLYEGWWYYGAHYRVASGWGVIYEEWYWAYWNGTRWIWYYRGRV